MRTRTHVTSTRPTPARLALLVAPVLLAPIGRAQDTSPSAVGHALDFVAPGAEFGRSVAVDGDFAAVGATEFGIGDGTVSIYRRLQGEWTLHTKLSDFVDPARMGASAGWSVALDGDVLAVGAPFSDENGLVDSGAVAIYEFDGATWTLTQKLASGNLHASMGYSVALDDDVLAVGAPGLAGKGGVQLYDRIGSTWTLRDILVADTGDRLGTSIDVSGDVVVAGAPHRAASLGSGAVFRYGRDSSGRWIEEEIHVRVGARQLGSSVSIEGDTFVVGAPASSNDRGRIYVYDRSTGSWGARAVLAPAASGGRFGAAVALASTPVQGLRAVVGSPRASGTGSLSMVTVDGAASSIDLEFSGSSWVACGLTGFGGALAFDGEAILAGQHDDCTPGYPAGAVTVFDASSGPVVEGQTLQMIEADELDDFGRDVTARGDLMVASCPGDEQGRGGSVFVFHRGAEGWVRTSRLTSPDEHGRSFGTGLSTDGVRIAVGDPQFSSATGRVVVYDDAGAHGSPTTIVPGTAGGIARFGDEVIVRADVLFVSAPSETSAMPSGTSGAVYVFRRSASQEWMEEARLVGFPRDVSDPGPTLAVEGDDLFVGVAVEDVLAANDGAVYHFRRLGGSWTNVAKLLGAGTVDEGFGKSVAYDGEHLFVGSSGAGHPIHAFERVGGAFVEVDRVTGVGSTGLALDGGRLVVRAASGTSFVALAQAGGRWAPLAILDPTPGLPDTLGVSAALGNDTVFVGHGALDDFTGAVFEFAIDENPALVTYGRGSASECPCGNGSESLDLSGCRNSLGLGGRLRGAATEAAGFRDLVVTVDQVPASTFGILVASSVQAGPHDLFDGARQFGLPFQRFGVSIADGTGAMTWSQLPLGSLGLAGTTTYFQAFYRDPGGPCATGANMTNALAVTFAP